MKKRILALMMIAVMAFGLTACGKAAQEAGLDASDIKDAIKDVVVEKESEGTLTFTVPEGFVYDEAQMLYNAPDGLANINYLAQENDGSFSYMTASLMEVSLESQLSAQLGEQLDLSIDDWTETDVDGYDAVSYSISYSISGVDITQRQIIIDGKDNLHFLTFTQMMGMNYEDEFAACEASMKFE